MAPRAAEAAAETAMPPPMQDMPVERAAARHPIPKELLVSAAASAANAVPENISAEDTRRVPKNRNTLTARAVL